MYRGERSKHAKPYELVSYKRQIEAVDCKVYRDTKNCCIARKTRHLSHSKRYPINVLFIDLFSYYFIYSHVDLLVQLDIVSKSFVEAQDWELTTRRRQQRTSLHIFKGDGTCDGYITDCQRIEVRLIYM